MRRDSAYVARSTTVAAQTLIADISGLRQPSPAAHITSTRVVSGPPSPEESP
jgi:hypothetical protein